MTLEEFACMIDAQLVIRSRSTLDDWYAKLDGAEVKEGSLLRSAYGDGVTPNAALRAYAKAISGKRIVLNATAPERRREYNVPELT